LGTAFLGGTFFAAGAKAQAQEIIRVLILRDVAQLEVSGQDLAFQDLKTGRVLFNNTKFCALTVERKAGSSLQVNGHPVSARGLLLTSSRGVLAVNGRSYRGKLKILPGPNRDLWVINELPLEQYLSGLIYCEVPSQWSGEVLKVQAVVARTYATYQKKNHLDDLYDVDCDVTDQVYQGMDKEDARSQQAVRETEGELLLYEGHPIFAVYHACCGGKTESAACLWSGNFPYLRSTACNFCLGSPHFLWNYPVDSETLSRALERGGLAQRKILGIEVSGRTKSGRVAQVCIQAEKGRLKISGKKFRRLLGYDLLRSTNFVVKESNGIYHFSGLGWGHGVGLCQWGAKGMADEGADYRSILKYYYQGVAIGKFP
jgi:stage II sporulation protein D